MFFLTYVVVNGTKKNTLQGLHNLSVKIYERAVSLPEYQNKQILTTKQRIIKNACFIDYIAWPFRVDRIESCTKFSGWFSIYFDSMNCY